MRNVLLFTLFNVYCFVMLQAQDIRLNQVGYYSSAQKLAVLPGTETGSFTVVDNKSKQVVLNGTIPQNSNYWTPSQESVKMLDFSALSTAGEYYIQANSKTSQVFEVKNTKTYDQLLTWTTKGFYLWRASTAIEGQYATFNGVNYQRAAGHADNSVEVHASAATSQRPAGTKLSAPRGWYDAGDYNLYVVNAGYSVFFLAHAYESFPDYFKNYSLNIPESTNNTPDLLDELKWEYDWLLAMQDLDGGVYFKLTSKWFDAFEMPSADALPRYMVGKSTTSALDFAAMAAIGYRLFKNSTDYPGFADKCLTASEKAWQWAKSNPSVTFNNPSDISTGGYGDTYYGDEFFWAASELLISTGKQSYYNELNFNLTFSAPSWSYMCALGLMSLQLHLGDLPAFASANTISTKYTAMMSSLYSEYSQSAYLVPMSNFYWGSNGDVATRGAMLGDAYLQLNDKKYLTASMECLNYILGRNATGYCFVTGFGDKSPMNIHDRRSGSDGITNPIPGYLCGGPNTDAPKDCGASLYPSTAVAKSYLDAQCSYSTNEIAVNWNAPLVALLASTEYFNNPQYIKQSIDLQVGWNLISTNVRPVDSSITSLFNGLNVQEIKDVNAFWSKNQDDGLNLLKTITTGAGYMVKMNTAGTLTVSGTPLSSSSFQIPASSNWYLIGCPNQSSLIISNIFNATNCQAIKNFDGFWKPNNVNNSIQTLDPGKGYFIKK